MSKILPTSSRYRSKILDAARECFSAAGYAGTKIDDIAESAELNKRMIYIEFSSKDELYSTLLAEMSRIVENEFRIITAGFPNNIRKIYHSAFDLLLKHRDYVRLWIWESMNPTISGMRITTSLKNIFSAIEEFIKRSSDAGNIPPVNKNSFEAVRAFAVGFIMNRTMVSSSESLSVNYDNNISSRAECDFMSDKFVDIILDDIERLILL